MDYILLLAAIFLCLNRVNSYCESVSVQELQYVPPVFAADNFPKCKEEGKLFCRLQFTLTPNKNDSEIWQIIQKCRGDKFCLNRDTVFRFRCLSHTPDDADDQIKFQAVQKENRFLRNYSLHAHLDKMKCNDYSRMDFLTTYDYLLMVSLIFYLGAVAFATITDLFTSHADRVGRGHSIIDYLSIRRQWDDLKKPINDLDYNKMKCFQGVRTYNMALVVGGHTISSRIFSYTENTDYLEKFYVDVITRAIANVGLIIVQTNFMISGWLNAKMAYNQLDRHGDLTLQFVFKKIFMRYLRYFPTLAFVICLEMSNWTKVIVAPPPLEAMDMDYDACQNNWWASLLLVNNIFMSSEMCNLGLWYLSNDFQMYILSLLMFYAMFKFKVGVKMILGVMAFFWSMTFYLTYSYSMAVVYPYNSDTYQLDHSMASYELYVLYTSFYMNFGSYGVGLLFGYLHHRSKNHTFHFSALTSVLWLLLFFGLPSIAVYASLFEYSRFMSAIIGSTLKPTFALGIAIGLFGMIHGLGGIIKKICEWDFAEFVAKWSYSTYLTHFFVVFGRHLFTEGLTELSDEVILKSAGLDIVQSFLAGLVVHLIVERPMAHICYDIISKIISAEKTKEKEKDK